MTRDEMFQFRINQLERNGIDPAEYYGWNKENKGESRMSISEDFRKVWMNDKLVTSSMVTDLLDFTIKLEAHDKAVTQFLRDKAGIIRYHSGVEWIAMNFPSSSGRRGNDAI